jgi:hypothetical protein
LTVSHQNNIRVLFGNDLVGDIFWACSSCSLTLADGVFKGLQCLLLAVGVPEVIMGNVLTILDDNLLDCVPVVLRTSYRPGVVDKKSV